MKGRVFENPKIKDRVTILETGADNNGSHILVEVEMLPGGGNPWHYHNSLVEEFTAIEGELGIGLNKKNLYLKPGEKAIAEKKQLHRFFNPGKTPVRFHVKISPGHDAFLHSLCIGYGLAGDGLTTKNGIPKKFDHLAVLLEMSESNFPGFLSLIQSILKRRARKAKGRGVDKELMEKYCR
jgi:quercetin dioxygenase-like cupin family protein